MTRTGPTKLCDPCAHEWAQWLSYRPHYTSQFTLTDKPEDMAKTNHARWREVVTAQQALIVNHCERRHGATFT